MGLTIKKSGFPLHPQGVFSATLKEVHHAPSINPEWLPQYKLIFETEATDKWGNKMTVVDYATQKLTDQNKLGKLGKALGIDVQAMAHDQELAIDDLIGQRCRIVVKHTDRPDGSTRAKVTAVRPPNDDDGDGIPF